jgi:predicted ATPase
MAAALPLPSQAARDAAILGRERELAVLHAAVARHRLVTVIGAGGIGKTRLVAEFAAAFMADARSSLVFLALEELHQARQVASRLAGILGVGAAPEPERAVMAALRPRAHVLVFDNCEHLLAEVAALAEQILSAAPLVNILATSRESLGVAGEFLLRLEPLALPDPNVPSVPVREYPAIRLFEAAAQRSGAAFEVTADNETQVEQVCRRLEGMPLALKLAGARLASGSLTTLAASLTAAWRLPAGPDAKLPVRQRSMEATIAWSVALLSEAERDFFVRLGLFAGSFSAGAAMAVAPPGTDTAAVLATLAAKSMVVPLPPTGHVPRYRLLEPLRDFAARQLAPADERFYRLRLLEFFGAFYEQSVADYRFMSSAEWQLRYGYDLENAQDGLEWAVFGPGAGQDGVAEAALTLNSAMAPLAREKPFANDIRKWDDAILALLNDTTPASLKAKTLLAVSRGQDTASKLMNERATAALRLFRQLGDRDGIGRALTVVGASLITPEDVREAELCLREAETHLRAVGNRRVLADSIAFQAACRLELEDWADAERKAAEALRISKEIGCNFTVQNVMHLQVLIAYESGRLTDALYLARAQIDACRAARLKSNEFDLHCDLAGLLLQDNDLPAARSHIAKALDCYLGFFLFNLALHAAALMAVAGEAEIAARLLGFVHSRLDYFGQTHLYKLEKSSDDMAANHLAALCDEQTVARLRAEGALWDDEDAIACLRAVVARGADVEKTESLMCSRQARPGQIR